MLDSNHLPTDRVAPSALSGNSAGVQRELLEQYRMPARSNGACTLNDACSPFKPDYERKTESGRAWDKEAKKQKGTGIDVGPDGKYEVKPGDSLWGMAERLIKKEGGKSSAAEVQKRVKELVEANKENLPGLDCNPHLLKRGTRINIPGGNRDDSAAKPSEKPAENLTPGATAKPSDVSTDKPAEKPTDKPAETTRPEVCKPADIYKDMAKFPELSTREYMTACRIGRAVVDGDPEALKRAMNDFPADKESGERVARALNETFKDQGIVVDYRQYNYFRASTPDKQETMSSFSLYHRGADRYLEVSKENVGVGGPVRQGPGGSIDYGGVAYHSDAQRKATLDDMAAAMRRRYCP